MQELAVGKWIGVHGSGKSQVFVWDEHGQYAVCGKEGRKEEGTKGRKEGERKEGGRKEGRQREERKEERKICCFNLFIYIERGLEVCRANSW